MLIEEYFNDINKVITQYALAQSFNLTFDKRGPYEGFIRGDIYFIDGSLLHIREFIDTEVTPDRFMYVYHYIDSIKRFIFRYDNTGHHKELNLQTYPHHKHDGQENNIVDSLAPSLIDILSEIELLFKP